MIKIKKPSDAPPAKPGGFGWKLVASFFGTGFSPFAPGTIGSLATFIILWFVPTLHWGFWIATVAVTLIGVPVSKKASEYWGPDPAKVVIDEVAGCMFSVMLVPKSLPLWILAFLAFRTYDILKLPPARTAEKKLPHGWGIMLDDVIAGVYSFMLVHFIRLLFPQIGGIL